MPDVTERKLSESEIEALHRFGKEMRERLDANAHKGGWRDMQAHHLLARLCDEVIELASSLDIPQKQARSFDFAAHHLKLAADSFREFGPCGLPIKAKPGIDAAAEAADVANFAMMIADVTRSARRAPVQGGYGRHGGQRGYDPGTVAWEEYLRAWKAYDRKCRSGQSAERITELGGFGYGELIEFLGHEPKTWEPRQ